MIIRIHSHIGSGTDPTVWSKASKLTLAICRQIDTVSTVNLGGGFKVARVPSENSTELAAVASAVDNELRSFAAETGRQLRLEIEPGSYLLAASGALVAAVSDVVSTGPSGYTFVKLDTGQL